MTLGLDTLEETGQPAGGKWHLGAGRSDEDLVGVRDTECTHTTVVSRPSADVSSRLDRGRSA
jgi:hypothetical protein